MGLIHQANRIQPISSPPTADKKKIGLLGKIRGLCSYDILLDSFRSLLASCNAEKGGLLYPSDDGSLVLLLNTRFDLTTVRRFCPDGEDFNARLSDSTDWVGFSGSGLDHFESFFSSHERFSLSALHIKQVRPVPGSPYYIIIAESFLDMNREKIDLHEADRILPAFLALLGDSNTTLAALAPVGSVNQSSDSMKAHAQSAFDAKRIATLAKFSFSALFPDLTALQSDPDIQAVYFAIVHRIARQAGQSNILYILDNFDLQIVLFTSMPVDTELYFFQLMKPLEKIFGTHRISRIRTEKNGTASTVSAVMEFLTGEA